MAVASKPPTKKRRPDAGMVTVHEAANKLQVSPETIRRWVKKGLIRTSESDFQHRLYSLNELRRLDKKLTGRGRSAYRILKRRGKPTPFKAIELFSGCGGMALGFANAGLKSELLVEINRDACGTLRENFPDTPVVEGDVSGVDFTGFRGDVDVIAGGFPCQAFSYAGQSRGFEDTRGTLFFEFARCIKEVKPLIAVGENVRGLLKHDDGRTLDTMKETLAGLGYHTAVRLVRAQFLDVPQKRERLIILALRADADVPFLFPAECDYTVTLRDALRDVPDSPGQTYSNRKFSVMENIPEGGYWRDLPDPLQRSYMGASYFRGGGRTGMARRLAWDEPSLTLTCNPAQKQTERCHPSETRPLTTREYARIQTFPDSWRFTGSTSSVYKQVGNAVPVNLAYHVGRCVVAMLNPPDRTPEMVAVDGPFRRPKQLALSI